MRKNILRLLHISSYLCLFALLTACSFPTKIDSEISVSRDSNPDASGRPSPLVVRIYELKSDDVFNKADFYMLYDDEEATLGGDLLLRKEFKLSPGTTHEMIYKAHDQTRYLGVIAAYRNINQARWRASTKLKLNRRNTSIIQIEELTVSINQQ